MVFSYVPITTNQWGQKEFKEFQPLKTYQGGGGGAGDIIIHPYLRIQTLHHLETPFQQFDPFQG